LNKHECPGDGVNGNDKIQSPTSVTPKFIQCLLNGTGFLACEGIRLPAIDYLFLDCEGKYIGHCILLQAALAVNGPLVVSHYH
jgi:hypothetical protein